MGAFYRQRFQFLAPYYLLKLPQHGVKKKYSKLDWNLPCGSNPGRSVGGGSSSEVPVTSGVPDGICTWTSSCSIENDLTQNIQSQVDDTAVYLTIGSSDDRDIPQTDIDTLQIWE